MAIICLPLPYLTLPYILNKKIIFAYLFIFVNLAVKYFAYLFLKRYALLTFLF